MQTPEAALLPRSLRVAALNEWAMRSLCAPAWRRRVPVAPTAAARRRACRASTCRPLTAASAGRGR